MQGDGMQSFYLNKKLFQPVIVSMHLEVTDHQPSATDYRRWSHHISSQLIQS